MILFEPFFDQYLPFITFNGGVPVYVLLHPPATGVDKPTGHDWKIDFNELRFVSRDGESEILIAPFQTRHHSQNENDPAEYPTQSCG